MTRHDADKLYDARERAIHALNRAVEAGDRQYTPEALHRLVNGCVGAHDLLYNASVEFYAARKVSA